MNTFWIVFGEFVAVVVAMVALLIVARSVIVIGPAQVGLVVKRVSRRHNTTDTPIAFDGEAGYQSALLMPGVRFKLWPRYLVAKHPWVQVPAGEIGVVISQIGERLPSFSRTAARRACSDRCCLLAAWFRSTRWRSWWSLRPRLTACPSTAP